MFFCFLAMLFFGDCDGAVADRIGGSSLPAPTTSLKGRIADGDGATSVAVITTAVGTTTNAGPTFLETPSAFVDRGLGYAQVAETLFGRVDFNVSLSDRHYFSFADADEFTGQAGLSLTRDWGKQQTVLTLGASRTRDVEEQLTQASIGVTHAWTDGQAKPYVQAETALLDFGDITGDSVFANQDDRDRISSRVQVGLRLTLTEHVDLEIGGGVDTKHYLDRHDDFGVQRNSVSLYPLAGIAYMSETVSLRAVYMPFWRSFEEPLFADAWKHGYAVQAEVKLSDALKAFASARHGFEETDFLIASAAYESVVVAGVVMTIGTGSISLAASDTRRDYDGLALLGISRFDHKREIALSGEMPVFENVSLNGRVGYLEFLSSLGDVRTDALTVSLGLTYAAMQ